MEPSSTNERPNIPNTLGEDTNKAERGGAHIQCVVDALTKREGTPAVIPVPFPNSKPTNVIQANALTVLILAIIIIIIIKREGINKRNLKNMANQWSALRSENE